MKSLKDYIPAKKTVILVEGREIIDDIDFTFQALEELLVESQEISLCSFEKSVISKSTFNSVVLEGCVLLDSTWKSSSFLDTLFYDASAFRAVFEGCIFKNVTFSGCNFEDVIFKNCQFIDVKLAKDNLGTPCDIWPSGNNSAQNRPTFRTSIEQLVIWSTHSFGQAHGQSNNKTVCTAFG